jgi:ketosteroid isomerase-like protein
MTNLENVQDGYQKFADQDIEEVLAKFDEGIQWHECNGFPFIEGDGIYIGPESILQNIFAMIPEHYDGFNINITDLMASGDKVIMQGFYEGTWKETGKDFRANATHIWTLKNGKVTHFFQAVDTAAIIS